MPPTYAAGRPVRVYCSKQTLVYSSNVVYLNHGPQNVFEVATAVYVHVSARFTPHPFAYALSKFNVALKRKTEDSWKLGKTFPDVPGHSWGVRSILALPLSNLFSSQQDLVYV